MLQKSFLSATVAGLDSAFTKPIWGRPNAYGQKHGAKVGFAGPRKITAPVAAKKGERMEVDRPKARLNSPRKAIAKLPKGRGAFPRLPCKCGGMARYTHTTRGGWAFRLWYVCRGCTGQIGKLAFGATPGECRPRIVLSCETLSRELIDMVRKNAQTIRNRKANPWTSYSSPDAREAGQP